MSEHATNLPAERAVIAAALVGGPGRTAVLALADQDFTDHRHSIIAKVLRDMIRRDHQPDQVTLVGELMSRGKLSGPGSAGGTSYIADLASIDTIGANGMHYASLVRQATRVRMAQGAAAALAEAMQGQEAGSAVDELLGRHRASLEEIPEPLDGSVPDKLPTIKDLFDMEFTHDWLVPDLVERSERIVLVAGEGAGKSVMSTQWAITLAAGLHPFTAKRISDGMRVLLIDAENSARQTQRRYQWVGRKVDQFDSVPGWTKRISHQIRPDGLDVPGKDRAWLMKIAEQASPDLIVIGPAYKIMRGDPQRDSDVLALLSALDEVRVTHNAALLIEAHAGHSREGDRRVFRPYGSSVWLRWPEVGLGLTRGEGDQGGVHPTELEIGHWRGTREDRDWPEAVERGTGRMLPWSVVGSDYWRTAVRRLNELTPPPSEED